MAGGFSLATAFVEFGTKGVEKVHGAIEDVKKKLEGLGKADSGTEQAFAATGTLLGTALGSTLGSAIGGLLSRGLERALEGIEGLVHSVLHEAMHQERLRAEFAVITGSMREAGDLLSTLKEQFAGTTIDPHQYLAVAKEMRSQGESSEQVAKNLKIMANIATATGGSLEQMATAHHRAEVSGKVSLRTLIAMPPVAAELARQFGVSEERLVEMGQKGQLTLKDLNAAMEKLGGEGGKFGGMMAAQRNTVQGQVELMGTQLKTSLAGGFREAMEALGIKEALGFVNEMIGLFRDFGSLLKALDITGRGTTSAIKEMAGVMRDVAQKWRTLMNFRSTAGLLENARNWFGGGPAVGEHGGEGGGGSMADKQFQFVSLAGLAEKMQEQAGMREALRKVEENTEKTADNTDKLVTFFERLKDASPANMENLNPLVGATNQYRLARLIFGQE